MLITQKDSELRAIRRKRYSANTVFLSMLKIRLFRMLDPFLVRQKSYYLLRNKKKQWLLNFHGTHQTFTVFRN